MTKRSDTSSGSDEISPTGDTASDQLLHEAARVPSGGPLLTPGTRLSGERFVIQRRLGEGGMGVVFEALDTRTDAPVAIKTLSRVDAAGIYRMKREFRSLAGVAHPFLVPLYELFAEGDLWFFTMGLVQGARFDRSVRPERGAPLDVPRLRTVLGQLAIGVQAIHDAGKLHRDLKPSNVLVAAAAEGPRVQVLDFGLTSEASTPGATQTIERGVAGTPAYMAPEQAAGKAATAASDWYAVGVMLFEALSERLPFEGETLQQLLAKQTGSAPPVRSIARDVPDDLAELCNRLLARDPGARPRASEIHRMIGSDRFSPGQSSRPSSTATGADLLAEPEGPSFDLTEMFVGRSKEIGLLETALGETNDGNPVFVMVGGPSGIGKTTFVDHFLASVKGRGDAVILGGRCYQRESVPFKGFDGVIDALSRYLVRLDQADAARVVPRNAAALCRVFPVLGRVEAISSAPQRRGLPSGAIELRYRAFEALKELLARLAEERPLILSIDDLQWSDRDSARLLKHLLTPPDPPMLLLVATFRDDEPDAEGLTAVREALSEDESGRAVSVRRMTLDPLSAAESRRLAQQLLSSSDREQVDRVTREAGGSPFLIGELTRAAHQDDGTGDLESAILRRVADLPEAQRSVLHALSVAPRPVAQELLSRVVPSANVPMELGALLSARLAREVAQASREGRRLACYHDRIRETLLGTLPKQERAAWHERYVAALEASEPLDLDTLVDHALGAEDSEKAGDYALRAARHAAEAFALDRAVSLYETALEHLALSGAERAALLVELADVCSSSGRPADAARTFLRAAELDPTRVQELERRAGEQFFINGDVTAGTDAIRRALDRAGMDYDALLSASVTKEYVALLARGFEFEPRSRDAIAAVDLQRLDTLWASALGATWLLDQSPALTIAYVREALDAGDVQHVAQGRALLLTTIEAVVDPPGARQRLPGVVRVLEQVDTPMTRAWLALCRGAVTLWSGSDDLGLADFLRAEELMSAPENRGMVRELNVCRTGAAIAIGLTRPARVAEHVVRWMRLADETGNRYGRMQWRCFFGAVLGMVLGPDRARAEIRLGSALAAGQDSESAAARRMAGRATMQRCWLELLDANGEQALEFALETIGQLKGRDWDTLYARFGRSLVLLNAVAKGLGDRATLLAQVEHDAALYARATTLIGEPIDYPILFGIPEFLRGQLAAAAGRTKEARELFETAVLAAGSSPHGTNRHLFSWRLGQLVGGERGRELCAEAERNLAEAGMGKALLEFMAARF